MAEPTFTLFPVGFPRLPRRRIFTPPLTGENPMSPIRSILVLATVVTGVLVPLFIGHALANHENKWILYGLIMLVVCVVLAVLATRGGSARHAGA